MNKNDNPDYFEAMESEYTVKLDFLNGNDIDEIKQTAASREFPQLQVFSKMYKQR